MQYYTSPIKDIENLEIPEKEEKKPEQQGAAQGINVHSMVLGSLDQNGVSKYEVP